MATISVTDDNFSAEVLNSSKPLKNLVKEQTPGGLNWQGVNELRKLGYYRLLDKSLKKIYKRL